VTTPTNSAWTAEDFAVFVSRRALDESRILRVARNGEQEITVGYSLVRL
jgi:hypothetical protein